MHSSFLVQLVAQSVCSSLQVKGAQMIALPTATQLPALLHAPSCVTPDRQNALHEVKESGKEQPERISPLH
jgi:hypothetical protein